MQLFLGKFNVKLLTNHIFVCYNNSIERKGCCTMYTTIQEAHEIFRGISENKMFFYSGRDRRKGHDGNCK